MIFCSCQALLENFHTSLQNSNSYVLNLIPSQVGYHLLHSKTLYWMPSTCNLQILVLEIYTEETRQKTYPSGENTAKILLLKYRLHVLASKTITRQCTPLQISFTEQLQSHLFRIPSNERGNVHLPPLRFSWEEENSPLELKVLEVPVVFSEPCTESSPWRAKWLTWWTGLWRENKAGGSTSLYFLCLRAACFRVILFLLSCKITRLSLDDRKICICSVLCVSEQACLIQRVGGVR